jgi:thioesterase domain-containing protein/acyl carrier protein
LKKLKSERDNVSVQNKLEALRKTLSEYIGRSDVSIKTNLLSIGIDSLTAIQLSKTLANQYHLTPDPHILLTYPTLEQLSRYIVSTKTSTTVKHTHNIPSSIVKIRKGTGTQNLFFLHPVGGTVYLYRDLADKINPKLVIYGIQSYQLEPNNNPYYNQYMTVEEMAKHYISDIQSIQPTGPYLLVGASFGGTLAYEISYQLRQYKQQKVTLLAMMDTPHPLQMPKKLLTDAEIIKYMLTVGTNQTIPTWFDTLSHEDQLIYFMEHLSRLRQLMPGVEIKDIERFLSVYKLNIKAMFHYKLRKDYNMDDCKMIYFRKTDRDTVNPDTPEKAWLTCLGNQIKIHIVSGGHVTMLFSPHNVQMASIINNALSI